MAELLQEIASIIDAGTTEAGSTHATWPLWLSHLPDSTGMDDRAVALMENPGLPDLGGSTDDQGPAIERPSLQVLVRGLPLNQYSTAYEEAMGVARSVRAALHGFTGLSSAGGQRYVGIWHENGPGFIGFDQSKRPLFSANFRVQRSKS